MQSLLLPAQMPCISGISMPADLYVVSTGPAMLAGMRHPRADTPWKSLHDAGFSSVVCLVGSQILYNPSPLRILHSTGLEDLHHGNSPSDPQMQEKLIRDATSIVVEELKSGNGTVIHCIGGTGRTGTVIGCVLRELGLQADAIISYLDKLNRERGGRGWPETEWQADMIRKYA